MPDRDEPPPTRRTFPKGLPPRPSVMGVRVPPLAPAEEPTRNDLPTARQLGRRPTLTASPAPSPPRPLEPAPRASQTRSQPEALDTLKGIGPAQPEAGRSVSPSPESVAARVTIGDVDLPPIRKRHLRALWVWVAPVLISALGTAFGYVRGYAKGLADAAERLAAIEMRATQLGKRVAGDEVRLDAVENAEAAEETKNRAERATALRKLDGFATDLEVVKSGMPKIQGLAKPKP